MEGVLELDLLANGLSTLLGSMGGESASELGADPLLSLFEFCLESSVRAGLDFAPPFHFGSIFN